jgi:ElaB/YqjD/DUF883 family membrane-anchored ribosome-binding protein
MVYRISGGSPPTARPETLLRKAERSTWQNQLSSYRNAIVNLEQASQRLKAALEVEKQAQADVERLRAEEAALQPQGGDRWQEVRSLRRNAERFLAKAQEQVSTERGQENMAQKNVESYDKALREYGTEKLLTPSAEKFPRQFAAASGVVSVITAGAVSLVAALARGDLTALPKTLLLAGLGGIVLGLAFHIPPLWIHWRDFRIAEAGNYDGRTPPFEMQHGKAAERVQRWIFVAQVVVWFGLLIGIVALIARAPATPT